MGLRNLSRAASPSWNLGPVAGGRDPPQRGAVGGAGRPGVGHLRRPPFAASIDVPTSVLLTTADRLVKPVKQRALARAIGAEIAEVAGDHLAPWTQPDDFAVHPAARRLGGSAMAAAGDRLWLRAAG